MRPELSHAARKLVEPPDGQSSTHVADRAAEACEHLTKHLSRLLGEAGVRTLLRRSIVLASVEHPWLGGSSTEAGDNGRSWLEALEDQEPEAAIEGFVAVLSTFVGLLKRLIGEGLVERLLHELWPDVFPNAVKETP